MPTDLEDDFEPMKRNEVIALVLVYIPVHERARVHRTINAWHERRLRIMLQRNEAYGKGRADGEKAATERILADADEVIAGWYTDTKASIEQRAGMELLMSVVRQRAASRIEGES